MVEASYHSCRRIINTLEVPSFLDGPLTCTVPPTALGAFAAARACERPGPAFGAHLRWLRPFSRQSHKNLNSAGLAVGRLLPGRMPTQSLPADPPLRGVHHLSLCQRKRN